MRKKLLTILLVGSMAGSAISATAFAEEQTKETQTQESEQSEEAQPEEQEQLVFEEKIKVFEMNGAGCYVFYPGTEGLAQNPEGNPVILVFGDTPFTRDMVEEQIISSGLREIAYKEAATVIFANPRGDQWTDEDADFYMSALNPGLANHELTYEDGVFKGGNGQESILGSVYRIYLIGEGTGADFIAEHYLKNLEQHIPHGDGEIVRDLPPTSVMLLNPSKVATLEEEDTEIAVYVATTQENADAWKNEIAKVSSEKNSLVEVNEEGKTGLDASLVDAAYSAVGNKMRAGELITIPDYDNEPVTETLETFDTQNAHFEGYVYIPDSVDMTQEGTVPLVTVFTGSKNARAYGWESQWPQVAEENDFVLMMFNCNSEADNQSADTIAELIPVLKEEYPAVDESRIYAVGLSSGTPYYAWNLAFYHPELFAGIAASDFECLLSNDSASLNLVERIMSAKSFDELDYDGITIPFYYAGSTNNPFPITPNREGSDRVRESIKAILHKNQVTDSYEYDEAADEVWGIQPDEVIYDGVTVHVEGGTERIIGLASEDGTVYTAFASTPMYKGGMFADDAYNMWEFLKKFSRNEDGTIAVTQE